MPSSTESAACWATSRGRWHPKRPPRVVRGRGPTVGTRGTHAGAAASTDREERLNSPPPFSRSVASVIETVWEGESSAAHWLLRVCCCLCIHRARGLVPPTSDGREPADFFWSASALLANEAE